MMQRARTSTSQSSTRGAIPRRWAGLGLVLANAGESALAEDVLRELIHRSETEIHSAYSACQHLRRPG